MTERKIGIVERIKRALNPFPEDVEARDMMFAGGGNPEKQRGTAKKVPVKDLGEVSADGPESGNGEH